MPCGVYVQNFGEYGDPHNLPALALEAEEAGWDGFFIKVGATWWLEWLDEQRGTFAQMRERIRQGPPKV